ncbi:MAG TPA: DUF4365 domain-containing protein [Solirubrobacterales bacterium]|nr:DUF4365 domain-containing protein [Solirubrobacterales bacterium]
MPARPESHVVSDQAVAAVMGVVAQAGYAAEVVSQDYGEDLLVQTSHAGRMDASRLWLQVKGTAVLERYQTASGDLRMSVTFDHALRWSRSADLVVVVLWDVKASEGWFALPLDQVDPVEGFVSEQRTMRLRFDRTQQFSPEAVRQLAWDSRIEHFRQLMLNAKSIDLERQECGEESKLASLVALDFLILLGVAEKTSEDPVLYGIPASVRTRFIETYLWIGQHEPDPVGAIYQAAMLMLPDYAPERDGYRALPRVLIEEPAAAFITLLQISDLIASVDGD